MKKTKKRRRSNDKKGIVILAILLIALVLVFVVGGIKSNIELKEHQKLAKEYNDKLYSERIENERIKESLPSITCWGDSLTAGAGGDGTTYPKVLAELTGLKVYNMGVGGENTITIACRQGARTMMVNNITIPATTDKVQVGSYNDFYDNNGNVIAPLIQGDNGINTCSIKGVTGVLSMESDGEDNSTIKYYFKRNKSGEAVVISEPTPIITEASISRRDDITIIFIGQNGGYENIDDLVVQQRKMIEYTGHDRFIILGLTTSSADYRRELEDRMINEYGDKYINLREYLSTEGINEAGLKATDVDLDMMNRGMVPNSLLSDEVHGNKYFYELIGKQVYNKIIELNYLNEEQKEYLGIN